MPLGSVLAGLLRTWGGFFTVAHVLVMILTIPSHPVPCLPSTAATSCGGGGGRRAAGTSLTEISAPKAPPPPPPKRPRNQRVITVPVDGPATHDGSLGPQRASTRLHLCIPEPQRTNKQSGRVDIGVALATNCLGDSLEKSVCGFDERVQRQVERSFCLAASVSLSRAMLAVMPGIAGQCQMSVERGCVFQTPRILAVS